MAYVKLGGRRWRYMRGSAGRGNVGLTDYDDKTVRIKADQHGREWLETVVHEGLHAIFPFLSEEAVEDAGRELAGLILTDGNELERCVKEACRRD